MYHYLMEDVNGEQFLVGADNRKEAIEVAEAYDWEEPKIVGVLTNSEAEATGLDEF